MEINIARRVPRFVYLSDWDVRRTATALRASYGWRLDAANHRPLARSTTVWTSESKCRDAAALIQRRVEELAVAIRPARAEGEWRWHARVDGLELAVSVHAYPRRVECSRALRQFLSALAEADPDLGVVRHYGPPALRGYLIGTGESIHGTTA